MRTNNLTITNCEDISWRIAPSVLHVPFVTLNFIIKELIKNKKIGKQSINNLKACVSGMFVGLFRNHFKYQIIEATKQ